MAMNTLLDLTAPLIVTAACVLALCKGVDIFAAMTDGASWPTFSLRCSCSSP